MAPLHPQAITPHPSVVLTLDVLQSDSRLDEFNFHSLAIGAKLLHVGLL